MALELVQQAEVLIQLQTCHLALERLDFVGVAMNLIVQLIHKLFMLLDLFSLSVELGRSLQDSHFKVV